MKYRRLTKEELAELEREFVRFLAANSVTADDWQKLKEEEPGKAEGLIDTFSDIVFERTLKEAEYLEFKTPKDLKTFHFKKEKVILNGLKVEGPSNLDFTQDISPEQMLGQLKLSGAQLKLYTAEKEYRKEREQEMFDLMERGALISRDGALFKTLESLKKGNQ